MVAPQARLLNAQLSRFAARSVAISPRLQLQSGMSMEDVEECAMIAQFIASRWPSLQLAIPVADEGAAIPREAIPFLIQQPPSLAGW